MESRISILIVLTSLVIVNQIEAFTSISNKRIISLPGSTLVTNHNDAFSCHSNDRKQKRGSFLLYEPSSNGNDPRKEAQEALKSGFWNALSHTEKWISQTLGTSSSEKGTSDPYSKQKINYLCEMNEYTLAAIASIFRRFKEARQIGERHSFTEDRLSELDPHHEIKPFQETQVVIIPFCKYFDSYQLFEGVIDAINEARKNAKDFVTDESIEKMIHVKKEWNFNVIGASLHPHYGEKSPKQMVEEMEALEDDREVDSVQLESAMRKNNSRRSPYPTLIIEVQALPPSSSDSETINNVYHPSLLSDDDNDLSKRGVLKDIVSRLEGVFAKSAALHKNLTKKNTIVAGDSFYASIGKVSGIEELQSLAVDPIIATQHWIVAYDPFYKQSTASFTSSNVDHTDDAFEFVFSTLALNRYTPTVDGKRKTYEIGRRYYLIMPKFVSASATSLEKFMKDVKNIIGQVDGLNDRMSLSLTHPDHICEKKRSPAPVLIVQWYSEIDAKNMY